MRRLSLLLLLLPVACGPTPPPSYQPAPTRVSTQAFDLRRDSFFAAPWPDDRRLNEDGKVDLRRFPNPGQGSLMGTVLSTSDGLVKGFGLSSPIYLPFTGPILEGSLPASPAEARAPSSSLYLVALDLGSPGYGQKVALEWDYFEAPTLFLPGNVLAVRPVPGFPLEPKTRYALVLTTEVKDRDGLAVGAQEELWRALHGEEPTPEAAAHYQPLKRYLEETGQPVGQVAGATVFTTQPILDELLTLRDWLRARPPPAIQGLKLRSSAGGFLLFEGTYEAPNLQHGEVPYLTEGGDFRYDEAGQPLIAKLEQMRVAFSIPSGPPPPQGFRPVLYNHGTGGNYLSFVDDISGELAQVQLAAFGIDQVMHGPRAPAGATCFTQEVEICFFNPVNAIAGRNNARQAALDNVTLRRLIDHLVIPASLHPGGHQVRFDTSRVGFFGHSQGGFSGAPYLALEDSLAAAVVSGAGGHITTTVLVRTDPIDLRALAEGPLMLNIEGKESLDTFHPALALLQTAAEAADPLSYARYWLKRPQGAPKSLYLTSGLADPFTSAFCAEAMAAAAGVPQMAPVGREAPVFALAGLSPTAPPVFQNLAPEGGGPRVSAVFRQFPGAGHFPVFYDVGSRKQWRIFLESALVDGTALIPAP